MKTHKFRECGIWKWCKANLNFYRIHLIFFTILPLIASGIFYASSGKNHIPYVDCLFMCISAMTVSGLQTVLVADLTTWQQVILFILMGLGSTTSVSVVMIYIRRSFFRRRFKYIIDHDASVRQKMQDLERSEGAHLSAISKFRRRMDKKIKQWTVPTDEDDVEEGQELERTRSGRSWTQGKRPVIRKLDGAVRVNALNVMRGESTPTEQQNQPDIAALSQTRYSNLEAEGILRRSPILEETTSENLEADEGIHLDQKGTDGEDNHLRDIQVPRSFGASDLGDISSSTTNITRKKRRSSDPGMKRITNQFENDEWMEEKREDKTSRTHLAPSKLPRRRTPFMQAATLQQQSSSFGRTPTTFPQTQTIDFLEPAVPRRSNFTSPQMPSAVNNPRRRSNTNASSIPRVPTNSIVAQSMHTGFGGFPNPVNVAFNLVKGKLEKTNTLGLGGGNGLARTATLRSTLGDGRRMFDWDVRVGRNSVFYDLTEEQEDELGGVEYRALGLLQKIVITYWIMNQLLGVLVMAPYIRFVPKYNQLMPEYGTNVTWFSFFQILSGYSGTGFSLIDASLVPFEQAYPMLVVLGIAVLAGNTAFPVFLRLAIWIIYKLSPSGGRMKETLNFLLVHPRRCFIYLFPAYQTWFLAFVLVLLNCADWISFLVLNIGNSVVDALPIGTRIIDGLIQAFCVRSAGFNVIPLSSSAPALQVMYLVMMYVSVYPVAITIRTTNVYEEQSMGIFDDEEASDDAASIEASKTGRARNYIAYHIRKQLSFDMWWLAGAVWLIAIMERDQIQNPIINQYLNIFTIMFDIVSGYGTVGLSLGLPYMNTSTSGSFRRISKLVVCAVMIRGRHRGLPVAIDRATLLPWDVERKVKVESESISTVAQQEDGVRAKEGDEEARLNGTNGLDEAGKTVKLE